MYQRNQKTSILKALCVRRVVLLCGPRQCGKSTLARSLLLKDCEYRTLDDGTLRAYALSDPDGFVKNTHQTLIIDEVQRAPDLLTAIKLQVDQNNRPGQFLLTGSTNLRSIPGMTESLAGRIHKVRLRPLVQGEILGVEPSFLSNAFMGTWNQGTTYDRDKILETALRGGFPEVLSLSSRDQAVWHQDYVTALLEHDLRDIAHITRYVTMGDLVKILAAWSGKVLDLRAIGAHLALSRPTLQTYINALEGLYLIERINPWIQTDYERVGKHSKMYMTDGGLMAALLGWHMEQVRLDPDRSGKLVETFVFNELASQIDVYQDQYRLFHYRDHLKREIDFIIERHDGALVCIEVKSGQTVGPSDFKHMRWFRENVAKDRPCYCIVLHAGEHQIPFGPQQWAVPLSALWT